VTGEGSLFDVPPAAIGRFRVLHQLGAGTCGPVFRAVDPESDTTVAIKLFTIGLPPGRAGALAEALAALVHELPRMTCATTPLAAGLHGHTPYLTTSYAAGDSLDVALKQFGPAVLVDVVPRLRGLASTLDAAAHRDVWHGALHPRDVIVSESDTSLTGLGIWPVVARFGERLPVRRPYHAPELGPTSASASGDQFSLAALSYEWTTGRRAPSAFVPGDMAPVAGASREALALVFGRALHADPGRRYESSVAFVDDLSRIADQSDPAARPEPGGARARRRSVARADVPLPLDAFPAQTDPALPLNLESAPSCPIDEFAPETDDADEVLAFDEPMSPVAAASRTVGGPEDRSDARPVRAWVAGAAVAGLVIGLAAGYLMWGRSGGSAAVGVLPAAVDSASEPVVIEDPEPLTSPGTLAPAARPTPSREPGAGDETPPAAAASGNLLIRSTPAGATVFVDGERRGITPVTLPAVPLGTRVVRVQQDGFIADERRLTLTADRPSRSVEVRLRRASAAARPASSEAAAPAAAAAAAAARTGSLLIESRPPGAAVTVDGRPAGSTPLTLDSIPAGPHTVTMRLAGFRPVTATVRVEADERARVAASLTSGQEP